MLTLDKQYTGWTGERILRHVFYWGCWLLFYAAVNGSFYEGYYAEWFFYEVLFMTVKIPYSYLLAYNLFPKFIEKRAFLKLALLVVFYAFIGMVALNFLNSLFPMEMPGKPDGFWTSKNIYMIIDLIYVASPVVAIKLIQQNILQIKTNEKLKSEKTNAELQNLKNQLQPHFLFNTLNNIYGMVVTQEKRAAGSIIKLSDILSYMLYECNSDQVDLGKEVEILRNYIELEKMRYGDVLDICFDVHGNGKGKKIPPLLLMPFIENAFKHGPAREPEGSWIRIHLNINDSRLMFMIENKKQSIPITGLDKLESGIGLKNVKKRLSLLYPNNHTLSVMNEETFYVKLQISL